MGISRQLASSLPVLPKNSVFRGSRGWLCRQLLDWNFCRPLTGQRWCAAWSNFRISGYIFVFMKLLPKGGNRQFDRPGWGGKSGWAFYATRSPHRPNHLGLSVVRLEAVAMEKGKPFLELSGVDFLDQTPVFDIKPYIPYSDCIPIGILRLRPRRTA